MRRITLRYGALLLLISCVILYSGPIDRSAYSKVGDVIGQIYPTDIQAYVNDEPVPAYNIGGTTVIIIEELLEHGFAIAYNNDWRVLIVYTVFPQYEFRWQESSEPGRLSGKVYETDITTYVNGLPIRAYALGGKMAVAIEDLGRVMECGLEYSPYNMRAVWDGEKRTISLYFLYENYFYINQGDRLVNFALKNDRMSLSVSKFNETHEYSEPYRTHDFRPPSSFPLYYNDQRVGFGFSYPRIDMYHPYDYPSGMHAPFRFFRDISFPYNYSHYSEDIEARLVDDGIGFSYYYDTVVLDEIVSKLPVPELTYQEVLNFYTNPKLCGYEVFDQLETDYCTVLMIQDSERYDFWTGFFILVYKDSSYKKTDSLYYSASTKQYFHYTVIADDQLLFITENSAHVLNLKNGTLK